MKAKPFLTSLQLRSANPRAYRKFVGGKWLWWDPYNDQTVASLTNARAVIKQDSAEQRIHMGTKEHHATAGADKHLLHVFGLDEAVNQAEKEAATVSMKWTLAHTPTFGGSTGMQCLGVLKAMKVLRRLRTRSQQPQ